MADDLVAIAKIARPRGLKGEVVADILTDFPERFESLDTVTAVTPDGQRRDLKIEAVWFQNERVVMKFAGHDSADAAEQLRDLEICIAESDVAELDEGEFFDWQLEGCQVESVDGESIGTVTKLMRTGGTELLVVAAGAKEHLIPFAESICVEVDIEKKLVKVDLPEGLLDF